MPGAVTRERPILFSGPLVRALLAGRKSMTRRLIKPEPRRVLAYHEDHISTTTGVVTQITVPDGWEWRSLYTSDGCNVPFANALAGHCPYGRPGDTLWVRETHAIDGQLVAYDADGWAGAICDDGGGGRLRIPHGFVCTTAADEIRRGTADKVGARFGLARYGGRWRSPIHMPRWASRLTLRITEVRVQRLKDISEDDAEAEGVEGGWETPRTPTSETFTAREAFASLWDEINGKRAPWSSNPWVWVISFEVVT